MYHPKDQSYGQDTALKEYIEVINAFKKFCESINIDSNKIAFIIDLTVRKVRNVGTVLNIRNIYSEPEKVMQA